MRGTVKIRNSVPWIVIAILTSGAVAQAQDAAPAPAAAPAQTSATAPGTVPVTTSSLGAQRDYELGLMEDEAPLFVDRGMAFFRRRVKATPRLPGGAPPLPSPPADPTETKKQSALAV